VALANEHHSVNIVSNPEEHTEKQYEKVHSIDYHLMKHSDIVNIDYLYYLKQLV
jgi:hypothetical protein